MSQDPSNDFDNFIGFWIKGMPYIFAAGDTVEKCKRIYTPPINKNIAIFDKKGNKVHPDSIPDSSLAINELCSILPLSEIGCEFVRNCFLVDVGYKKGFSRDQNYEVKNYIEGKEVNTHKNGENSSNNSYYDKKGSELGILVLSENITIVDPATGYKKNMKLRTTDNEISLDSSISPLCTPLTPDFLPTKVVYTKESRMIAERITQNYKKIATTKEKLVAFYNTHHESEIWSTNKTAKPKYYEWFTTYTKNINKPTYIDMGCGSGKDAILISKEINASRTICADVKDSRVTDVKNVFDARKENIRDVLLRQNGNDYHVDTGFESCDYSFMLVHEDTPLNMQNDSIDVITLFHTIHHMRDAQSRLQDLHRILKHGGLLIIKDHNVKTQTDADNVTFEHFVYSIGEGEATVNDEETYKDILPMYYYSADTVNHFLECIGFTKLYLNTYNNATKTYNAVYKKK
jgi:ubiquinone/menaquinone biosynthesis C-methylase UbiE